MSRGRRIVLAGLAGGGASLVLQFLIRGVLELGPRLADIYPEVLRRLEPADAAVFALFFLVEAVLAALIYAALARRLPGRPWVKGLIFGGLVWAAVNLLPLLGLGVFLTEQPLPEVAHWSLTWLLFIQVQTIVTAVVHHAAGGERRRRG